MKRFAVLLPLASCLLASSGCAVANIGGTVNVITVAKQNPAGVLPSTSAGEGKHNPPVRLDGGS